jgi:hypothetical protein
MSVLSCPHPLQLLEQTKGKGIDIYTHGEMLPAHSYPGLKKYDHLAGHFGGAWYRQKMDFAYFPGAILATTNCILDPMALYRKNLFTTGEVRQGGGQGGEELLWACGICESTQLATRTCCLCYGLLQLNRLQALVPHCIGYVGHQCCTAFPVTCVPSDWSCQCVSREQP